MLLRTRTRLTLSLGVLLLGAASVHAAERMATGQWEFAMTTAGATHAAKHCVTADEAGSVNGSLESARAHAEQNAVRGHCALKAFGLQGDTVTYSLACGPRTIDSTSTYHGESFDGTMTTTNEGKAVVTKVSAHRLGVCP